MNDRLRHLSLSDLTELKTYLMRKENIARTCGEGDEAGLCQQRWVEIEREIQRRIENLFA